jgi:glutamine synthetase
VPTSRSWGHENRSTAVRVPLGDAASRRIEFRVPSADANPYLVLAALLAGMHHGISEAIEPPPPTTGNACRQLDPEIPFRLRPALQLLSESKVLRDYLGADYCDVFEACKAGEVDRFESTITGREYAWYLLAD